MPRRIVTSINQLIKRKPTPKVKELIGKKIGKLYIKQYEGAYIPPNRQDRHYYTCVCDCHKELLADYGHLKNGDWTSCGCERNRLTAERHFKHGYAPLKGKREKIYHAWKSMHARCSERAKDDDSTRKYGEKGIKVCEGWSGDRGFLNFKEQMNPPTDKSLDRIDNDLHYSCGKCDECKRNNWVLNCRWANDDIQSNNRGSFNKYIIVDGIRMNHRAADRYLGYPIKTISGRIASGWTDEQAISIFPKLGNRKPTIKND